MADEQKSSIPVPDPTLLTTELLRRELLGLRELVEAKLSTLREVHEEKFESVRRQFTNDKIALDAALQAQKEQANERAAATTKTIDSMGTLTNTSLGALQGQLTVLAGRLDRGEGSAGGQILARTDSRASVGQLMTAGSLVLLAAAVLISGLALALHH